MRALSIRQPYGELILRGIKRIEYRSRPTRIIGERFWIYASKGRAARHRSREQQTARQAAQRIWSDDLAVPGKRPGEALPVWMMELAERLILDNLPTGVIVGSAVIVECTRSRRDSGIEVTGSPLYEWHLAEVEPSTRFRKPTGQPQPVWFTPF
jgi:hypothetical protein